jgi:hypothetical protein
MAIISRIWNQVTREQTPVRLSFRVADDHVLDGGSTGQEFQTDQAYFEVRLAEQFLKNKREYFWNYIPLTLTLSGFIYDGKRQSLPGVVGPTLLQEIEELDGEERVRFRNTRLAGPAPYGGDGIDLFVGLFRIMTDDWARETLKLLESVARSFDASRLTEFVHVAEPLASSIESFLGREEIEFRLGERTEYTDPTQNNPSTKFRAGYWTFIRADRSDLQPEQFWVKNNQLHFGPGADSLQLYRDHDYLLLSINHMEVRSDYTTMEFHREWEKAQETYWNSPVDQYDGAKTHMRALMYQVQSSPDLIPTQREALLGYYFEQFQKEKKIREQMEGLGAGDDRPVGLPDVDESSIAEAMKHPSQFTTIEPDADAL